METQYTHEWKADNRNSCNCVINAFWWAYKIGGKPTSTSAIKKQTAT